MFQLAFIYVPFIPSWNLGNICGGHLSRHCPDKNLCRFNNWPSSCVLKIMPWDKHENLHSGDLEGKVGKLCPFKEKNKKGIEAAAADQGDNGRETA